MALLDTVASLIPRSGAKAALPKAVDRPFDAGVRLLADSLSGPGIQGHRIDILIAEDNEVNQLVFTQILARTPYAFQIVANGRLACEAFRDMNPRLILMDVAMPEMDGFHACAVIRRMGEGRERVPIIGIGAQASKEVADRCLQAGMDDALPKPIHPRILLEKVEHWIGRPESKQERPK